MDFHQNYFELFGLPVSYDLDDNALTERYRDLQKVFHPDHFASASDQERRLSLQQAAQINSAYDTLRDPLARARYLLTLQGLEYNDESSTIRDMEFLEEQMELRERLADIR
ncbi:MAG: Fe-S protein assembly co-chaperone HscB, partial [Pseudomonadota bacterium]|nr:Fe-S protein assembly co-chaperone HscB [Pseudomonadota bacterium]